MITIRLNTIKAVWLKRGSHGNQQKLFILSIDLNSNLHTLDYRDVGAEREERGERVVFVGFCHSLWGIMSLFNAEN